MLLAAGAVAGMLAAAPAHAQETVKIGLILPMTGGQASTGKQIDNAVKLYMQQHGDTVAGKKIEVILKDDGAVPDNTKRLAQELIVNDKVNFIAGFGVTPAALAATIAQIFRPCGAATWRPRAPYCQSDEGRARCTPRRRLKMHLYVCPNQMVLSTTKRRHQIRSGQSCSLQPMRVRATLLCKRARPAELLARRGATTPFRQRSRPAGHRDDDEPMMQSE